jgi:hypothetical protein
MCRIDQHSVLYKLSEVITNSLARLMPHSDLDRSNISNAYVSGMKEELNMMGNQFNVSTIIFLGRCVPTDKCCKEDQYYLHLWLYRRNDTKSFLNDDSWRNIYLPSR